MISTDNLAKTAVLILISTELMFAPISGAKILFIPANFNSHVQCFSRLASDLAQLGHVTRVLAPSNARVPHFIKELAGGANFSYTTYQVDGEEPYSNSRQLSAASLRLAASHSTWEKLSLWSDILVELFNHCESDCARLVENDHILKRLRDEGYQFAVMDPIVAQCYYAIPYSLGVPYASLSVPGLTWLYRVPRFPSFVPSLGFSYTDRMSFVQRLTTFLVEQLLLLKIQNYTTTYVDRLAPDRPSINSYQLTQQV